MPTDPTLPQTSGFGVGAITFVRSSPINTFFIHLVGQLPGFAQGNAMRGYPAWLIDMDHPARFALDVNRRAVITVADDDELAAHFDPPFVLRLFYIHLADSVKCVVMKAGFLKIGSNLG
jgi:hypothetical protein